MTPREWLRALTRKTPDGGEPPANRRPRDRGPGSQPPIRRTGLGLLLIAAFRREGLEEFGNSTDAYLASLAPLIAFALVSCVLAAASGAVRMAAQYFLIFVCSWLAPAVISHPLCRRWNSTAYWSRYVNILNWSQMLMFLVLSAASAAAKAAVTEGLEPRPVLLVMVLCVVVYAVSFHWFVARGVLQMSRWRTVLLLVAVAVGTNLIISVPLVSTGSRLPAFTVP
jgi:hypothetical protein